MAIIIIIVVIRERVRSWLVCRMACPQRACRQQPQKVKVTDDPTCAHNATATMQQPQCNSHACVPISSRISWLLMAKVVRCFRRRGCADEGRVGGGCWRGAGHGNPDKAFGKAFDKAFGKAGSGGEEGMVSTHTLHKWPLDARKDPAAIHWPAALHDDCSMMTAP